MAGLLGDGKGPIEAVREFHGERPYNRRTMGTPARTFAVSLLYATGKDAEDLGPDYALPELLALASHLTDSWAGHGGWDSDQSIALVEAATNVRTNPMVNGNAPDGPE